MLPELGVAYQKEVAKSAFGTAIADDIVHRARGIEQHPHTRRDAFDIGADRLDSSRRFMAQRKWLVAPTKHAVSRATEIAAADATSSDPQNDIVGAGRWHLDVVDAQPINPMNSNEPHSLVLPALTAAPAWVSTNLPSPGRNV